jgi:hypothetical protein
MNASSHVIAASTAAWAPASGGGVIPGGGCVNDPVGFSHCGRFVDRIIAAWHYMCRG